MARLKIEREDFLSETGRNSYLGPQAECANCNKTFAVAPDEWNEPDAFECRCPRCGSRWVGDKLLIPEGWERLAHHVACALSESDGWKLASEANLYRQPASPRSRKLLSQAVAVLRSLDEFGLDFCGQSVTDFLLGNGEADADTAYVATSPEYLEE